MKIISCEIRNFRGLEDINMSLESHTCLIAGPNAIGKSTVLEAIRLNRALLMPRYPTEGQAVLHSLGATTNPNQMMIRGGYFDFSAIARDLESPIVIRLMIRLDKKEIQSIRQSTQNLALDFLRGRLGTQLQQDPASLTQFLSSAEGKSQFDESKRQIEAYISTLSTTETIPLGVNISPTGQIQGDDAPAQIVCGFLERSLPPQKGLFSYFSADRALPTGEATIQLGSADADNQIKSHIAEPQLKSNRLKISLANSTLLKEDVDADFKTIFDEILPGKSMPGIRIGPIGNFRVAILEQGIERPFDIDNLSSGEKGLILTFLLIKRTIQEGGIVLIDEPELHLNPGICRKLLDFLIDHCIKPNNLQAIICTHSAEILNSAYERDDCRIHHLKDRCNATPIYRGDFEEIFRALGRLGVTPAESFFYESRIFVEGHHDEELLEEGFRMTLGDRCQINSLGGRKSVEAEVENLQKAETDGHLDRLHVFIFDRDRNVTSLESSKLVKVLQWDRYCFENYLLNTKVLYDVLKDFAGDKLPDRGVFQRNVKELAFKQILPLVARDAYDADRISSPGLEKGDIGDSYDSTAEILESKLAQLKTTIGSLELSAWKSTYIQNCRKFDEQLRSSWEKDWVDNCNGKELLEQIFRKYQINRDRRELKKDLIRRLRDRQEPEWKNVQGLLTSVTSPNRNSVE